MEKLNVVDSCGWLEYFVGGPNARHYAEPIESADRLIVPTVIVLEVVRKVLRERGEDSALIVAALMRRGKLVDLSEEVAFAAARLHLPLADAVIMATAQSLGATLWTQDDHFQNLSDVKYFPAGGSAKKAT